MPTTSNLRPPWKPGESGNPAGRPRKRPLSDSHEELLRSIAPPEIRNALNQRGARLDKTATWSDCISYSLGRKAIAGDVTAAKELRESVEGKSTQRIELAHLGERQELLVVYAEPLEAQEQREGKVLARLEQRALPATTQDIIDAVTNSDEESKEE